MRTDSRHKELADFVGCTVEDVETAFSPFFGFGMWAAKRSETGEAKEEAAALNAIADEMDKLIRRISAYKGVYSQTMEGLPTANDLCALRDHYRREAKIAAHFTDAQAYPATKGRKEQARIVAEAVARLYVATGRTIGKGTSQLEGDPTSKFGKTVKKALEIYGVDANWRQPAKDAASQAQGNTN
jgi:hypothetical protein